VKTSGSRVVEQSISYEITVQYRTESVSFHLKYWLELTYPVVAWTCMLAQCTLSRPWSQQCTALLNDIMSKIECGQLHNELFGCTHSTLQLATHLCCAISAISVASEHEMPLPLLSANTRRVVADTVLAVLCLSVCVIICCKQDPKTNLWIFHKLMTHLDVINSWCRSLSRWLTFSHVGFWNCRNGPNVQRCQELWLQTVVHPLIYWCTGLCW